MPCHCHAWSCNAFATQSPPVPCRRAAVRGLALPQPCYAEPRYSTAMPSHAHAWWRRAMPLRGSVTHSHATALQFRAAALPNLVVLRLRLGALRCRADAQCSAIAVLRCALPCRLLTCPVPCRGFALRSIAVALRLIAAAWPCEALPLLCRGSAGLCRCCAALCQAAAHTKLCRGGATPSYAVAIRSSAMLCLSDAMLCPSRACRAAPRPSWGR